MSVPQWKIASIQLLEQLRKSGVSQIPKPSDVGVERVTQWLKDNAMSPEQPTAAQTLDPPMNVASLTAENSTSTASKNPLRPSVQPVIVAENRQLFVEPKSPVLLQGTHAHGTWQTQSLDLDGRHQIFHSLKAQADACRKCEEIVCRRKQAVFGVGPIDAKLVMFGEAPGADEDRIGEPFVGAAGQLMDKILIACGLKREQVYIMNSLKCRPPNNRTPTDSEVENCRPYFELQLETIQPEFIVCWGAIAVRAVLGKTDSIGSLRGRFHSFRAAKVLVTYHPAYLLRNPSAKKLVWEDMKMLMREIGIPVPGQA